MLPITHSTLYSNPRSNDECALLFLPTGSGEQDIEQSFGPKAGGWWELSGGFKSSGLLDLSKKKFHEPNRRGRNGKKGEIKKR